VTGKGHLVAVSSHRFLRGAFPVAASVFAVGAVVATALLTLAALNPAHGATQPSLEPPSRTAPPPAASPPITATAGDQTYRLDLPDSKPRGLVVLFPDAGADAAALLGGDRAVALLTAGWAVATTEFHGASWGSPQSSQDVQGLLEWASGYVEPAPLVFSSEGMGATTSLMAMSRSSSVEVTCWLAVEPRTDLKTLAQADPALEEQIVSAWTRVPKPAQLPLAVTDSLPAATVYRIAEATADAPEPVRADAAALSAALQASGHDVGTLPGDGLGPDKIVQTAEACRS